jgi:hypothetical protein
VCPGKILVMVGGLVEMLRVKLFELPEDDERIR